MTKEEKEGLTVSQKSGRDMPLEKGRAVSNKKRK